MKKKIILSSVLSIMICLCLIAGSTYALFTSQSQVNIAATSGKVAVEAILVDSLTLTSLGKPMTSTFENGGTATIEGQTLTLENITPGDKAEFAIQITNNSTVNMQYRIKWTVDGTLFDALVATADGAVINNGVSDWTEWTAPTSDGDKIVSIPVSIELPAEVGNEYQEASASISFTVEAVQGNGTELFGTSFVSSETELQEAIAQGGNIVLKNDIAVSAEDMLDNLSFADDYVSAFIIDGVEVTLDLNGFSITVEDDPDAALTSVFFVENGGDLTINGNGSVTLNADNDYLVWARGGSTVTINGGEFRVLDDSTVLYAHNATINVNGGSYATTGPIDGQKQDIVNVLNFNLGTINITGGRFYDFNPATDVYPDDKNAVKVLDGYTVEVGTASDGVTPTYTVVPMT